jgi:iron(II)-dependent oxidoreductase
MSQSQRKMELREAMESARANTLRLLDFVPDDFLKVRVHDFYSPIGWHFGHIGMTEELWVIKEALKQPCRDETLSFLFANLPENPKDNRVHLPSRKEITDYLTATRCDVLDALEAADLTGSNPLLTDGYAWTFAQQHECQHQETIAEMLQLIQQRIQSPAELEIVDWAGSADTEMVKIPGGTFMMGSNDLHGYDNEKNEHLVEVALFEMDRTSVTAFQWTLFMKDGGYRRKELWSPEGWAWREAVSVGKPEYWHNAEGKWAYYGPLGLRALHPEEPVSSLSWYEADAYARWVGKRLPTEAEWELAAAYDPATGNSRRFPWGDQAPDAVRAHHALQSWSPQPVGALPQGATVFGLLDMAGNVWEWTSSPFLPYPDFQAYPYDGYSKDHMDGKHYVCRGGSWATAGTILRCSFRNWYVPTYRQGFLGMRCAR